MPITFKAVQFLFQLPIRPLQCSNLVALDELNLSRRTLSVGSSGLATFFTSSHVLTCTATGFTLASQSGSGLALFRSTTGSTGEYKSRRDHRRSAIWYSPPLKAVCIVEAGMTALKQPLLGLFCDLQSTRCGSSQRGKGHDAARKKTSRAPA